MKEHEWLGVAEHQWFSTRYGIRLPDGTMAISPLGMPWTWEDREMAERAIAYFQYNAQRLGVTEWRGEIVRQFCTPWIGDRDNADILIRDLSEWLARETGGSQ